MALLSDEEIDGRLGALSGWERDGDAISKDFKNADFKESVAFVNRVMPVAEAMNHHPDLAISWNTVTVAITTHSEGGLTENDFELASRIDALG
jgi:4a-hydroxytetrahydrobiopterin dehydratase